MRKALHYVDVAPAGYSLQLLLSKMIRAAFTGAGGLVVLAVVAVIAVSFTGLSLDDTTSTQLGLIVAIAGLLLSEVINGSTVAPGSGIAASRAFVRALSAAGAALLASGALEQLKVGGWLKAAILVATSYAFVLPILADAMKYHDARVDEAGGSARELRRWNAYLAALGTQAILGAATVFIGVVAIAPPTGGWWVVLAAVTVLLVMPFCARSAANDFLTFTPPSPRRRP